MDHVGELDFDAQNRAGRQRRICPSLLPEGGHGGGRGLEQRAALHVHVMEDSLGITYRHPARISDVFAVCSPVRRARSNVLQVIQADPAIDLKMVLQAPAGNTDYKIRRIEPPFCND
jgi:hypothetical protein